MIMVLPSPYSMIGHYSASMIVLKPQLMSMVITLDTQLLRLRVELCVFTVDSIVDRKKFTLDITDALHVPTAHVHV